LPIQHISDGVLKRMARRTKKEDLLSLLRTLRHEIPDLVLRTSLIVGFPGETEEEFKELYDFVDEIEFDKLGVFTYSKEEGTAAALMKGQIRKDVKERRRNLIMERQQEVSRRILERKVGKTYEVLVEGMGEDGYYGRSFEMAPEVDGMIIIKTQKDLMVGSFVDVKIIEALEYDLVGVLL
ncbi:radical SAM protein, partial [Proteiniclasticum ruminis]|uniref:radical SAM protein n=1 Tax=Proteiniclasticum ruminis TaxID=398199 RepID=UPI0028A2DC3C